MLIRVVHKGWEGFTGSFGTAWLQDGVADGPLIEAQRIGSLINCVDEDGRTVNPAYTELQMRTVSAEVKPAMQKSSDIVREETEEEVPEEEAEELTVYSKEELEKIADESGIKGLREIGDPLGVKGTSITALIEGIIQAQ